MKRLTTLEQGRAWERRHAAKREALRRGGKRMTFRITKRFHESFGRTAREAFAIFEDSYKRSTRRD